MESGSYFRLYSNCIPVKGILRSIICDLQRSNFHFIPNGLYDILINLNQYTLQEIKSKFENKEDKVINEYFDFLIKNDLGFFCTKKELDLFPAMNLSWDEPFVISNAIIDINADSKHNYKKIFLELEELGCGHIQLRVFSHFDLTALKIILELFKNTTIKSCELILKYTPQIDISVLEDLFHTYSRIKTIYIHSSPENSYMKINSAMFDNVLFVQDVIDSASHCGIVNPTYFGVVLNIFTEALTFNSCLNKKIGIDVDGNIKNCPSISKSYGNHKDVPIKAVLNNKEFKSLWSINKDQIEVCKDCEFRYICTDCRAYIEKPSDIYSKPLKCGYSPNTAKWEEWSTNPLKQVAIEYYDMQDMLQIHTPTK